MPVRIDGSLLDELRQVGDPPADQLIDSLLADGRSPAVVFRGLVDDPELPREVQRFLDEHSALPPWADPSAIERGVRFFAEWGMEIGLGLFCCALPIGYAAVPVAQALDLTARLETDVRRRVFETAQMVLDVTSPDGLAAGGRGITTTLRVRLMHAGVRRMIRTDPRVQHSCADVDAARWCDDWGTPLSQEHLLGALLAFGYSMLRVLDTLGLHYDETDADGYLHLWSVVGHLMGIQSRLLPLDLEAAKAAYPLLEKRDVGETAAGRRLTAALLAMLDECGPDRLVRGMPASTMRILLGDELADVVGVPRSRWQRVLFQRVRPVLDAVAAEGMHDRLVRSLVARFTRAVMVEFVHAERRGDRPKFQIPDHLQVDVS